MAQVLVPYGVQGWIKLRTFSGEPDAVLGYRRWWLRLPGADAWREVKRLEGRVHSGSIVARLEGVDSREAALALRGADIGVLRDAMPELGEQEFYWADLVGLDVVNRDGVVLGQVTSVQDYGAHPVLRVAPGGRTGKEVGNEGGEEVRQAERLIPFVDAHVDKVDVAARRIDVDWQPDY